MAFQAIVVALLLLIQKPNSKDPYEYSQIAVSLFRGEGIQYRYVADVILPPGFPFLIGGFNWIVSNPEMNGKIVCVFSFFLSVVLFFLICQRFFKNDVWAFASVVIYSMNSNVLVNATNGYSESLFTAIFLWIVLLVLKNSGTSNLSLSIKFALLWGFLYYIRPEGIVIGAILFVWFFYHRPILQQLIIPIITLILIFPYIFFLKENTGYWQVSGKTFVNLTMGELQSPYQSGIESEEQRYKIIAQTLNNPTLSKGIVEYMKESSQDLIARLPHNFKRLFEVYWNSFSLLGLLCFGIGFFNFTLKENIFTVSLLFPVLIYVLFFVLYRTIAIYHWIWVIYIVNGVIAIGHGLKKKFPEKNSTWPIAVLLIALSVYQFRSVLKIFWDQVS